MKPLYPTEKPDLRKSPLNLLTDRHGTIVLTPGKRKENDRGLMPQDCDRNRLSLSFSRCVCFVNVQRLNVDNFVLIAY